MVANTLEHNANLGPAGPMERAPMDGPDTPAPAAGASLAGGSIRIRGARTHNLKDLDLDIPRGTLTVITGLSGSGKSSLAFDTIYAEGQRRYVESLSAYARQFLQLMQKPDVDSIEGLSPAISIEQKTTSHNPRSTIWLTVCACSGRGWACRIRLPPACRSRRRRSARWWIAC